MKPKDILDSLNDIDSALVADAAPRRTVHRRWIAAAACLVLLLGAALGITRPWELRSVDLGGVTRLYRNTAYSQDSALIFPWEYRPVYDQYHAITFAGNAYRTRANAISPALLAGQLGEGEAFGYDIYTDSTYTRNFPVYAIAGIDPALLLAVEQEGIFYVFMAEAYDPPATLGQFLDGYALPETLLLDRFGLYDTYRNQGSCKLADPAAASEYIWQLLSGCREAVFMEAEFDSPANEGQRVSFTATSEKLGIYKKGVSISAGGYLDTNIAEYGYVFYIGEEAAQAIIDYVLENSTEAEPEPYDYRLTGTVTEICDGYFLLDDSVLAAGKGMTFRVPTEDLLISRWLDFGGIGVGDLIAVSYTGGIKEGTVQGAYNISPAFLADGQVLIPE